MRAPILLVILVGCGRSTASRTIEVGPQPIELAAGDLDGDGRPDLAVARADGTVVVHLNGAWRAAGAPVRVHAHMLALGDVDADGKLDLVTTDHDSGDVMLARGRGDGRFGTPEAIRAVTAAKPHNHGLVVADLDGDGDADVVVADQVARQLVVLVSDGRTLVPRAPIALPHQPYPPAAGDLDGDGNLDLVVPLVGSRAIAVLLNKGGEFTAPRTFATTRPRPYGVVVGDVDGDRRADVVVSHDDTDDVIVMAGNGKGELVEQRSLELPCRIGTRPALVDLDGDGALDLVGIGSGRLVVAENRLARIRSESAGGWRVIATDLDGDRKPDLAAPDSDGGVVRLWLSRR